MTQIGKRYMHEEKILERFMADKPPQPMARSR